MGQMRGMRLGSGRTAAGPSVGRRLVCGDDGQQRAGPTFPRCGHRGLEALGRLGMGLSYLYRNKSLASHRVPTILKMIS